MDNIVKFSFPGLGIKGGEVSKIAFGSVAWYGVVSSRPNAVSVSLTSRLCSTVV